MPYTRAPRKVAERVAGVSGPVRPAPALWSAVASVFAGLAWLLLPSGPLWAAEGRLSEGAAGVPASMVLTVNGGVDVTAGKPFDVAVLPLDSNGLPLVGSDGAFLQLSLQTGTGPLSGTLRVLANPSPAGWVISGLVYTKAEPGVVLTVTGYLVTATFTMGAALPATSSAPFTVVPARGGVWLATGNMTDERSDHTATLLPNGKVLVAGGGNYLTSAELYDPATGTWSSTGSMAQGRSLHTATLLPDGRVLVAGGFSSTPIYEFIASAEIYDPATGTWNSTGGLNQPRGYHTATLLPDGQVLAVGGTGPNGAIWDSAEIYNGLAGTWTVTGSLQQSRTYHTTTLLADGTVLAAGGLSTSGMNSQYAVGGETYRPVAGSWSPTGPMAQVRSFHAATRLADGKVLVVGGYAAGTGFLYDSEVYDPVSRTWLPTGSLPGARTTFSATLMPNGKVLVAGEDRGIYVGAHSVACSDLYDPATGTWGARASMVKMRDHHTATLLPDGRVLAVGGASDHPNSAELYALPALVVTNLNGGQNVASGTPFPLTVQVFDGYGNLTSVVADTTVQLTIKAGTGSLTGTLTRTIPAGGSGVTFTNLRYGKAEVGIVLSVSSTSGDDLTVGYTAPFAATASSPPPVIDSSASASPSPVFGKVTQLSVTAHDPDSQPSPLTYTWTQISGPGALTFDATNGTASGNSCMVAASVYGTYVIEVSVSNGVTSVVSSVTVTFSPPVKGDFSQDGSVDILWRQTSSGQVWIWKMAGTQLATNPFVPLVNSPPGLDWQIVGTADFDQDGNTDILWRQQSTGDVWIWKMSGTTVASVNPYVKLVSSPAGNDWQVVGTGDFDKDGNVDILWRQTSSGQIWIWRMNGTAIAAPSPYVKLVDSPAGDDWQVVGTGDFDKDGSLDILWRQTSSGQVWIWKMNGTSVATSNPYIKLVDSPAGADWNVVGTGDFDGDGNMDILWRQTSSGDVWIWKMNGTSIASTSPYVKLVSSPAGDDWQVRGPK